MAGEFAAALRKDWEEGHAWAMNLPAGSIPEILAVLEAAEDLAAGIEMRAGALQWDGESTEVFPRIRDALAALDAKVAK